MVASQSGQRQETDAAGRDPNHGHRRTRPAVGHGGGAGEGSVDAYKSFHGHRGTEKQRAKAVEDHWHTHEVAQVAMRVQLAPIEVRNVEGHYDGPGDQQSHEVGEDQPAEEEQEGGAWAALGVVDGVGQNHQSEEVGAQAEAAEDRREVRRGHGVVVSERRAVNGEAKRSHVARCWHFVDGEQWWNHDGDCWRWVYFILWTIEKTMEMFKKCR